MHETSKSILRRIFDQRFATRYLVGDGIDIGSGAGSVGNYGPLFPQIINVLDLLSRFNDKADTLKIERLDHAYMYGLQRFDQSQLPATETAIEFVLRKRTPEDIDRKGTYPLR